MEKKYNIVLGLMIFFFLIIVGVAFAWGLGYIGLNTDKTPKHDTTIETENNTTNKIDYSNLVVDGIKEKKVTAKCPLDNEDLYCDVTLPKINVNSKNAQILNADFNKIYETESTRHNNLDEKYKNNNYSSGDVSDNKVTYEWSYVANLDLLHITILIVGNHGHATGYTLHQDYFYNVKDDKILTKKDVLDTLNISENSIEKAFKESSNYNSVVKQGFDETQTEIFNKDTLDNLNIDTFTETKIIFSSEVLLGEYLTAEFNY